MEIDKLGFIEGLPLSNYQKQTIKDIINDAVNIIQSIDLITDHDDISDKQKLKYIERECLKYFNNNPEKL